MKDRRNKDILESGKRHWIRELIAKGYDVKVLRKLSLSELIGMEGKI